MEDVDFCQVCVLDVPSSVPHVACFVGVLVSADVLIWFGLLPATTEA